MLNMLNALSPGRNLVLSAFSNYFSLKYRIFSSCVFYVLLKGFNCDVSKDKNAYASEATRTIPKTR